MCLTLSGYCSIVISGHLDSPPWNNIQLCKKNTKFKNHIYVSSDSVKILDYAHKCSAKVIKRPKNISTDKSSTEQALSHVILSLEKKGFKAKISLKDGINELVNIFYNYEAQILYFIFYII